MAANTGPSEDQIFPTAIIPIVKMGLLKVAAENNLAVDAAKVNPTSIEQESLQSSDTR